MTKLNIVEVDISQRNKITTKNILWLSQFVLILIVVVLYFLNIEPVFLLLILIFILMIMPLFTLIYGYNEYFPKNYKVLGSLEIYDNHIKVDNQEFEYKNIISLHFIVYDYHGERLRTPGFIINSGPSLSQGIDNYLEIESKENNYRYQFQIPSLIMLEELGIAISKLYKKKIKIKETYQSLTSYGLKHLTYMEIQKFKKEYIS